MKESPPTLTKAQSELAALLAATPGAMPLHEALGFMTAFVSMPSMISPGEWLEELFADAEKLTDARARKLVDATLAAYDEIASRMEAGEPVGPASEDDAVVAAWCLGYHRAAVYDELWLDDEGGMHLLSPIAAAGGPGLISEEHSEPEDEDREAIEQLGPDWKAKLPQLVAEIHTYFEPARAKTAAQAAAASQPFRREERKIGRNEPCPCGSGKKYKRCCGAH